MSEIKKVLIITSSGGGGLLQTANAKEQEVKELDPGVSVVQTDILKAWLGKWFGQFCIQFWNQSQRTGSVWTLKLILHVFHPFSEYLFWPFYFLRALQIFFKENPDRIIDTQPLATSPILAALGIFNQKKGKKLCLEKVLVDLPTTKATHFFRSIKTLSQRSKALIRIVTIPPLLENGETAKEFWHKHCRLPEEAIVYEEPFVRTSFRKRRGILRSKDSIFLKVRYQSEEELALMEKVYKKGCIESEVKGKEISFKILPEDRLITVLLGSQPAGKATFNYAKEFLEIARKSTQRIHLFLFRVDHKKPNSLLFRIADWIDQVKDYPTNFTIVPFGFQHDDVIASLFHRSDITCTRSGGQTVMELLSVCSGDMWIHSETKGKEVTSEDELLKGIPGWERASAVYLKKLKNAKIVTPETFVPLAENYFHTRVVPDHPNSFAG